MKEFTQLEAAVLKWMAERLNIPHLQEQIKVAVVTDREYTGVGFFTSLSVPSDTPSIHCSSPISGPVIESNEIEHGGGAIVFLDDKGHIKTLEMYANGSHFQEVITSFELKAWKEEANHCLNRTVDPSGSTSG